GYFNPVLLAVIAAQLGLVIYQFFGRADADGAPQPIPAVAGRAVLWLAGCGLALLLLWPELGYWSELRQFSQDNKDVLNLVTGPRLLAFLFSHNSALFVTLVVVVVVGYVSQRVPTDFGGATAEEGGEGAAAETAAAGAAAVAPEVPPHPATRPMDPAILWLGGLWVFLPQLVMLWLAYRGDLSVLYTRYLTYTTLGGAIFLAYWAGRYYTREGRLSTAVALAAALVVFGFFTQMSKGYGLFTFDTVRTMAQSLDELEEKHRWLPGDVAVHWSPTPEAALLPDRIPAERQPQVKAALLAPYTTLYVPRSPKPIVLVDMGLFRPQRLKDRVGSFYQPDADPREKELAAQLRGYKRFWLHGPTEAQPDFVQRFLPWLADAVHKDLVMARNQLKYSGDQRYFVVPYGIPPQPYVKGDVSVRGLSDARPGDFTFLVAVRQVSREGLAQPVYAIELPTTAEGQLTITPAPRELFTLAGVGGALPSGYGAFAAPAWLGALAQSPYVAPKTDEEDR
ncbi:MAG TPA: hypothetical protein VFA26_07800, partial [Gemmataceae bacterium]|nr:hypothetical protein [Gemmataceae bacterium]